MDVFVLDPYGMIIGSTVPMLWNYYGGGEFLPSNNMLNGTSLTVPVDGTGLYTIVLHQTNAGGGVWPIEVSGIVQTEGITISGLSPYMYGQANAVYQISSPVPISSLQYRVDTNAWINLPVNSLSYASGSISINISSLSVGPHTLKVMMSNSWGLSYLATYVVTNVGPAPKITINSPSNNAYVKGTINVSFTVSGSYISKTTLMVDGIAYPFTANSLLLNTSSLTDGPHTITVTSTNMAGYSGSATIKIIVNNNAPYAEITSPSPGSFVKGIVTVNYVVSGDYIKNVTLMLDNKTINETFNSLNFKDGSHVLKLTVTNEAGTAYTTSESIYILNTPPTVTITSPSTTGKLNGTIAITFTVSGDHVNSVWLYIDNMGFNVTGLNSYAFNTTGLADGNHTIKVVASNFAGSTSNSITIVTNNQALAKTKTQNAINNAVSGTYVIALPIGLVVGLLIGIPIGYIFKKGKKGGVKPWQEPPKETTEEKKE